METWGRGFKKVVEEFERAQMPLPVIEEIGGGVMVGIQRKTIEEVITEHSKNSGGDIGGNVAVIELSNRQRLILSYITKRSDITAKQMAVMTDIPQRTIERELAALQKMEVLRHEGSPRTGRWIIIDKSGCQ